jgi:hypothetical protein
MPITATLAIIAAAAMAGVPLLNGFLSKEMFFAETVGHPQFEAIGWLCRCRHDRRHARRRLLVALRARRLLQRRADRPAAPAARAAALDARADRAAGPALSAGRRLPGWTVGPLLDAPPAPRCRHPPGIRTGAVARLQSTLDDEPAGAGRRRFHLRAARAALRLAGTVAADAPAHRLRALLPIARRCARRTVAMLDNGSLQRYNALLFSFHPAARRLGLLLGPAGRSGYPVSRPTKPPTLPCSRCCSGSMGATSCIENACWR